MAKMSELVKRGLAKEISVSEVSYDGLLQGPADKIPDHFWRNEDVERLSKWWHELYHRAGRDPSDILADHVYTPSTYRLKAAWRLKNGVVIGCYVRLAFEGIWMWDSRVWRISGCDRVFSRLWRALTQVERRQ